MAKSLNVGIVIFPYMPIHPKLLIKSFIKIPMLTCYWLIERWVVKVVKVMNLQRTSEASCGSSFKGQHPAEAKTQVKGETSLNRAFSK